PPMAVILSYRDLRARGIPYSKVHLRRLWTAGKFPAPFQLVRGGELCWMDKQIDDHVQARIAARDRVGAGWGGTSARRVNPTQHLLRPGLVPGFFILEISHGRCCFTPSLPQSPLSDEVADAGRERTPCVLYSRVQARFAALDAEGAG